MSRPGGSAAGGAPAADVARSLVLLPFYPPVVVALLTLLPLLYMEVRVPGTMGLAYAQGREPALYFYGLACVLAFSATYQLAFRLRRLEAARAPTSRTQGGRPDARLGWLLLLAVLGLVGVGLVVVYLTVRGATAERLALVLAAGQTDPELRAQILGSDTIPGMVRMLNYLVPGALVLTLAAWLARVRLSAVQMLLMFGVALGALCVRSVVFMDRQPVFMAALLTSAAAIERVRWTKARVVAAAATIAVLLAGLLALASVLAQLRGGELLEQNTILHYADLGVANTIAAMRSETTYSLGVNSIWSVLTFVPRGIGLGDLPLPYSDAAWVWNPAANMLCYSYQDFGPFGVVTYLLLGTFAGFVCGKRVTNRDSLLWAAAYLWCVLALLGIWTVPLTRGTEFWSAVAVTTAVAYVVDRWPVWDRAWWSRVVRARSAPPQLTLQMKGPLT